MWRHTKKHFLERRMTHYAHTEIFTCVFAPN